MIRPQFSVYMALLLSVVALLGADVFAQQYGRDCRGNVTEYPPEEELECNYWVIKLYKKGAKSESWGAIMSKTREGAERELSQGQRLFPNSNIFPYDNPGQPICDLCGTGERISGKLKDIHDFVEKYHEQIEALGIARKLDGLYKKYTSGKRNPYSGVGSLIKTYEDNVADASHSARKLEKMLSAVVEDADSSTAFSITQIDREFDSLKRKVDNVNSLFDRLPPSAQKELDSADSAETEDDAEDPGPETKESDGASGKLPCILPSECCGYSIAVISDKERGYPSQISNLFRSPLGFTEKIRTYVRMVLNNPNVNFEGGGTREQAETRLKSMRITASETLSVPDMKDCQ